MKKFDIYKFEITETLRKVVEVEANSKEEAYEKAWENYGNGEDEYVLNSDNHEQTEIIKFNETT